MRRFRALCYKLGGVDVKLGAEICGGVRITGHTVSLGRRSFIGTGVLIEAHTSAKISIGEDVAIGPKTMILTSTHEIGTPKKRAGLPQARSVSVEDGAWIGAGVTILPGVTVGRGAVIAAGTVVHKDVEASVLVAGQPSRTIRALGGPT
jgi:acetyltransferase-like isoleucine patch superfamily enzyme